MIVCSFSNGLDDMRRADQSDPLKVLQVLSDAGRFSVFDATANLTIARTVTRLYHKALTYRGKSYGGPLLKIDNSMGYPWSKVVLTEAGKQLLSDYAAIGVRHNPATAWQGMEGGDHV